MALDDLDLEFEDEEEAKKKKNDAVHQDVDLEFHVEDNVKPRPAPRPGMPAGAPAARPAGAPQPMAQVKPIAAARPQTAQPRPQAPGQAPRPAGESTSPKVVGANALKIQPQAAAHPVQEGHYDLESAEIVELRERARKAEFDAAVKVEVAEFKTELLSELLSDMKLMDHQINQLLVRMSAKHPELKQEALMIKKLLADFTAKKRK